MKHSAYGSPNLAKEVRSARAPLMVNGGIGGEERLVVASSIGNDYRDQHLGGDSGRGLTGGRCRSASAVSSARKAIHSSPGNNPGAKEKSTSREQLARKQRATGDAAKQQSRQHCCESRASKESNKVARRAAAIESANN